jgi:hypothetical protein
MSHRGEYRVTIDVITRPGKSYAVFRASEPPPNMDDLPLFLQRALEDWFRDRPNLRVKAAMGVVENGNTTSLRCWFEEAR